MNYYTQHQNLIKIFKIEIQKQILNIRIFDRHVGLFYTKNGTPISINFKGMADCYALVSVNGMLLHIELEFKTGKAKQTKEQKRWQKFIESLNGIYLLVNDDYYVAIEKLKMMVAEIAKKQATIKSKDVQ